MREACLEVEAVAACMAARPGQPQRCQLAGACSTRWIRCPAPRRALCSRSRSSAEPRRPPRRAGVPLHFCRPGSVRGTLHTPSGCPRIQDMLTRKRMPSCPARQMLEWVRVRDSGLGQRWKRLYPGSKLLLNNATSPGEAWQPAGSGAAAAPSQWLSCTRTNTLRATQQRGRAARRGNMHERSLP